MAIRATKTKTRTKRLELKLFEEEREAYEQAASRQGYRNASDWARVVLAVRLREVLGPDWSFR